MATPKRTLKLTSPYMRGDDIRDFQTALNGHAEHYAKYRGCPGPVKVDGEYGPATRLLYRWVAFYVVGFLDHTIEQGATADAQRLIRKTSGLNHSQRARARDRQKRLHAAGGFEAVLHEERKFIGKHESGHNRSGPGFPVDTWEREVGLLGEPYCGIAQTYFIRHFGGVPVTTLQYTPNILMWGHARQNGLELVSYKKRRPGALMLFKFPGVSNDDVDHVGGLDDDLRHTIEFNTSDGNGGSQNNGGGCYRRDRGTAALVGVVLVTGLY